MVKDVQAGAVHTCYWLMIIAVMVVMMVRHPDAMMMMPLPVYLLN